MRVSKLKLEVRSNNQCWQNEFTVIKEESKYNFSFYMYQCGEEAKEVFLDSGVSQGSSEIHQRM